MSSLRDEERAAIEIVRRTLDATFTAFDDGTVDGQVEGLFVLPNGYEGALEVTTLTDPAAMQAESLAARKFDVPGARWAWTVQYGATVDFRALGRYLSELILTCEALDARSPEEAHVGPLDAFAWYRQNDVSMYGHPESNRPGAIDVLPKGAGGAAYEHLDALPDWLGGPVR